MGYAKNEILAREFFEEINDDRDEKYANLSLDDDIYSQEEQEERE